MSAEHPTSNSTTLPDTRTTNGSVDIPKIECSEKHVFRGIPSMANTKPAMDEATAPEPYKAHDAKSKNTK